MAPTTQKKSGAKGASQGTVPARTEASDSVSLAEEQTQEREQAAKDAEKQRDAELKAGRNQPGPDTSKRTIPEQRSGVPGTKPSEGRVDNMTRRHDGEPLQGHFVGIDLSNKAAKDAVELVIGEGNARFGSGDYGVFDKPGAIGDDGYPVTAIVTLHDEHNAIVVVPYDALSPANAGRR